MSDGGDVTVTGLDELVKAVEDLPRAVTLALRAVAWQSSRKIKDRAAQLLDSQTHGTGKTAASIEIIDEEDKQQFVVWPKGNPDRPPNLPLWLERGTRYMTAKPYLRPAADEEDAHYKAAMLAAATRVADETLK